ncbi:GNAT family N-acetyltransferase [Marinibaculum pumilum]|uniref:GNAT family N-acetyltransferase n=1 Tax=Marinibaculum pumilum TaxID=1766165 RepID=A0ABV7KVV7_9PROT
MTLPADIAIAPCPAAVLAEDLPAFGALLHACVHAGASIGFILPFAPAEAEAFWRDRVLPPLTAGHRVLLAARAAGRLVGTVQLGTDTMPNQPHRADVAKLMVHPDWRRRGIARALMVALEAEAQARRRTLLTLDTRTGDAAEPLYLSMGYRIAGPIPGYCLHPSEDRLEATTIMYKAMAAGTAATA